ncbi:MAG: Gfo/Idh/MocA family oxidoreductase, partial [Hyphomicrobiales bacterium]|nr:Gfo/Idh/MocA family oxidoreductase [Hyphomicrobiales bacterium]
KGAGPILVNLVHDVDLLRHLVGEIVAVRASRSNAVRGNPVEEGCVALLEFAGGALGTLNASDSVVAPWSWEHSSGENPSYPRAGGDCYFLGGTKGSLSVPRLETWENEGAPGWLEPFRTTRATAADRDPLAAQMAHFGRVIRGEETPLVSGAEGLATLRAVHAIARAAETGERVEVAPG